MSNYKEEQAKRKQRKIISYDIKSCIGKKFVIDGELYMGFREGIRKVGVNVNGKDYFTPPDPKNKKERRKMREGKPYIDKQGNIRQEAK